MANKTPAATTMKLAIPERCNHGHVYFRESGTTTGCPYCLSRAVRLAQDNLSHVKAILRMIDLS